MKEDLLHDLCFNELLKQNFADRLYEPSLCLLLWGYLVYLVVVGDLKRICQLWAMFRSNKNIICLLGLLQFFGKAAKKVGKCL